MNQGEWISDCIDILIDDPFHWQEGEARSYASGLLSTFGLDVDPSNAIAEDRKHWES
jgi:hypothetical protein